MASEILGLFTSPQQYQQQQQDLARARAMEYAKLDPFTRAEAAIGQGAYNLAGAIGGALGGVDPQLQKITQRQQLLGMIDPANPDSYGQAIQAALQVGDQEAAFLLRNEMVKAKEQAQTQQLNELKTQDYLTQRGQGMQQRGMEARALSIANGINPDTGEPTTPLFDATTQTFNRDVANLLVSQYGQAGANLVKQRLESVQGVESLQVQQLARTLFNPDGTRNPEVEKQLSTTVAGREVLKKLAPETKELKKGEKLMERQPDGTWKLITPIGMPTAPTTGANAVNDLIAGKAIHPTILPYANQIAKSFASLDPEDQDKAIEKLTTLNNTAMNRDDQKTSKDMFQASTLATQELTRQMLKLQIAKAQETSLKAADGKEIKLPDATKLAGQASNVDKLSDLNTSFKPEFAGYPTNALGEADIWRASKSNDPKDVELYQWWQGYQDHVNRVRNELFGAALTAPEKAEFEKAMVTKGMNSSQAKANLDRQAQIALKAYNKLDSVLRVQGYSKSALDVLKPTGILPPLENFIVQTPNTNPSNVTGGRR